MLVSAAQARPKPRAAAGLRLAIGEVVELLTISRLSRWSINYYNETANQARQSAMDRQSANGGLGEYYSEADTRVPTWVVVGDNAAVGERTGLDGAALDGGFADTADGGTLARRRGRPERGHRAGVRPGQRARFRPGVRRAQERVAAAGADRRVGEKVMQAAHLKAVEAAMAYLHEHAGYTRVHNPLTGKKDLQRLPGLVAIAYQHETSRCGDPHLHTHVIVPNRQPRADGQLVSIDSKSLHHEAKAGRHHLPGRAASRTARRAGIRVEPRR